MSLNHKFKMSNHAIERWGQRFPRLDTDIEWSSGIRLNRRDKRCGMILKQLPLGTRKFRLQIQSGEVYYVLTRSGIVFVCGRNHHVLTVFQLRPRAYGDWECYKKQECVAKQDCAKKIRMALTK